MENDSEMTVSEGVHTEPVTRQFASERLQSCFADRDGEEGLALSIVVPVYKEEGNISEFLQRVSGILTGITGNYEIIFCLDPSPDRTARHWRSNKEIATASPGRLLRSLRRFLSPRRLSSGRSGVPTSAETGSHDRFCQRRCMGHE